MTLQPASSSGLDIYRKVPAPAVLIISIVFHIVVLVVLPIMSKLLQKSRRFERPKTFQLVASPFRPNPTRKVPVREDARKQWKPQEERQERPRQTPDQNALKRNREAQKQQDAARPMRENLDELASILDEIPAPAQVAAVGNFRYHWYLNSVQQKLMRYWRPTSENKKLKVIVAFTINRDGTITDPSISTSSGNSTLDNLALRAVTLAAPFGKLPPGFKDNKLDINCTLIPTRN